MKFDYIITISINGTVEAEDYKQAAKDANNIAEEIKGMMKRDASLRSLNKAAFDTLTKISIETDILIPVSWTPDGNEVTVL